MEKVQISKMVSTAVIGEFVACENPLSSTWLHYDILHPNKLNPLNISTNKILL